VFKTAEDEIVVACTSLIFVSLGAASVMADVMADLQTQNVSTFGTDKSWNIWHIVAWTFCWWEVA